MAVNYVLISEYTTSITTASVSLSNIPQTGYTDLKLAISAKSTRSNATDTVFLKFNNTATTYTNRRLYGFATTVGSDTGTTGAGIDIAAINGATSTANTFSNQEVYIPNYLGSGQKIVSLDSVDEINSSTGNFLVMNSGMWNGTSAISTITLTPDVGSFVAGSTFSLYGIAAVGTTPSVLPKATGGDIVVNDGTYWYHAFLSSGVFTPSSNLSCDYLVVAGGGGGGYYVGAGGGAGGLRATTAQSLLATAYPVTVGAGGIGGIQTSATKPTNGNTTTFNAFATSGGGAGGGFQGAGFTSGVAGGSGGGGGDAGATYGAGNTGSYSPVEGYRGGVVKSPPATSYTCSGGGGAGMVGYGNLDSAGGYGGDGTNSYNSITFTSWLSATQTGVSGYLAGGGGGGGYYNAAGGLGGAGGGGSAPTGPGNGTSAVANTGSGGGGASANDGSTTNKNGGSGGSGIVIVRYTMA